MYVGGCCNFVITNFSTYIMKKSLLILGVAAAMSTPMASAVEVRLDWYKQLGGEKQISVNQVAPVQGSTDIYAICSMQFPSNPTWGGEALNLTDFTVDSQSSVASPYSVMLARINDKGDVVWHINNSYGDAQLSNGTFLAPTSDGGVVMAFHARNYSKGSASPFVFEMSGTNGVAFQAPYTCPADVNPRVVVLVKVNANGEIAWVNQIDGSTPYTNSANASINVTDPVVVNAVAVDDNDNIYVAGYYVTEMTVAPFSGSEKKLAPLNTPADWDGKGSYGDSYILKLDKDGKYLASLTVNSDKAYAGRDQICGLVWSDGALYFTGMVADASASFSIGNAQVSPSNDLATLYAGKADTNLNIDWLTTIESTPNSAGKVVIQPRGLLCNNGYITATGALNGGMKANGKAVDSGEAKLHGYGVSLNPATGAVDAMVMNPNKVISSDFAAYTDGAETTTYGYQMGGAGISACNYLMTYDNATGSLKNQIALCNANITYGAYFTDTESLYAYPRTSSAMTILGTDAGESTGSFDSWLVKFSTSGMTGIENVAVNEPDADAPAEYFDLSGRKVLNPANGLYIVRRGNKVTKEILK